MRIDPRSHAVVGRRIKVRGTPMDLAVGEGRVWVVDDREDGAVTREVTRLRP
jgi:hypothetical protein